jgi:hypothetical protein
VLRLWSDCLQVGLGPERLSLVRVKGLSARPLEKMLLPCASRDELDPWCGPLSVLRDMLKAKASRNSRVTVILSNRWVHYLLVPWSGDLASEEEWRSWIRHHFQKVFGAAVEGWAFRWQAQGAGRPLIASAVEQALLDGIESAVKQIGGRLRSVQPHLMAAFNRSRKQISQSNLWWVLAEPGHVSISLLDHGAWQVLRTRPTDPVWAAKLPLWLEREHALRALPDSAREVVVEAPGEQSLPSAQDWSFRRLPSSGVSTADDAHYAMAWVGG